MGIFSSSDILKEQWRRGNWVSEERNIYLLLLFVLFDIVQHFWNRLVELSYAQAVIFNYQMRKEIQKVIFNSCKTISSHIQDQTQDKINHLTRIFSQFGTNFISDFWFMDKLIQIYINKIYKLFIRFKKITFLVSSFHYLWSLHIMVLFNRIITSWPWN